MFSNPKPWESKPLFLKNCMELQGVFQAIIGFALKLWKYSNLLWGFIRLKHPSEILDGTRSPLSKFLNMTTGRYICFGLLINDHCSYN